MPDVAAVVAVSALHAVSPVGASWSSITPAEAGADDMIRNRGAACVVAMLQPRGVPTR